MEILLLLVVVLAFIGLFPPLRRIVLFFLGFGFVGYAILGGAIDQDPENSSRNMALWLFGAPWVIIFSIGFVQSMAMGYFAERRNNHSIQTAVERNFSARDAQRKAALDAEYQRGRRASGRPSSRFR